MLLVTHSTDYALVLIYANILFTENYVILWAIITISVLIKKGIVQSVNSHYIKFKIEL